MEISYLRDDWCVKTMDGESNENWVDLEVINATSVEIEAMLSSPPAGHQNSCCEFIPFVLF